MAQSNRGDGGSEHVPNAGAEGEDPLHAPVPAGLPDRRAHHGAGRQLAGADRLLQHQSQGGGLLGLYDLFTGGELSRATVFALGIMPYISASIFMQIARRGHPARSRRCRRTRKAGKRSTSGRATPRWSSRSVQAWGFALFTESLQGAVREPGLRRSSIQMVVLPDDGRDVRDVAG